MNESLRQSALAIWQAGVDAVKSDQLVLEHFRVDDNWLIVDDVQIRLNEIDRIAIVGCGKAGAGMANGVEAALGESVMSEKDVTGWINVPDDCVRPLRRIHLHGARPAGLNEPTEAGVFGAEKILQLVKSLSLRDLCLCLISGGGSALLPAPVEGITLADKQAVTRFLSSAGANIQQLNTVRKQLSRIKGGGLLHACEAGHVVTLIISDVLGDPLDVIASGPTVADATTPHDALEVLELFGARQSKVSASVFEYLERTSRNSIESKTINRSNEKNLIIGNNSTAVAAAGREADKRGFHIELEANTELEGDADDVGRRLARIARKMSMRGRRKCLVSGGEPTVRLAPADKRGKGGRNQQLVLAAIDELTMDRGDDELLELTILSGGTDGEDGPTDAAGAFVDDKVFAEMRSREMEPKRFLDRNDAYNFFSPLEALIRTGPTHTNVCDLRVVVTG